MKTALITGITGQDGSYLAELLLEKGYQVHGIVRRASLINTHRIDHIYDSITLHYGDLTDSTNLVRIIQQVQPDEIYNLGAQSHVKVSFETPEYTGQVDALGTLRILEAVRLLGMENSVRIYQASTSELYGLMQEIPQKESTPFYPRSPYGCAKAYSHYLTVNYRESYNLYACSGILFNHESPMRGEEFVTRKITKGLVEWTKTGKVLELGNLESYRDWGHAEDYVEAMWLMLQQDKADDYVIATGKTHSIKDFINKCLTKLEITSFNNGDEFLDSHGNYIIKTNSKFVRPAEVDLLIGDSSKAKKELLWKPKHDLDSLVDDMIQADLKRYG